MVVKNKLSKIKKSNVKRGKLSKPTNPKTKQPNSKNKKPTRLGKKIKKNVKKPQAEITPPMDQDESEESDIGEDLLEMVEQDDMNFLKNAITNRSYSLLKNIKYTPSSKSKKRKLEEDETLEEDYEDKQEETPDVVKVKRLLPIKTSQGFIPQHRIIEEDSSENIEKEDETLQEDENEEIEDEDEEEISLLELPSADLDFSKPLSATQLLIHRNKILTQRKLEIGVLSSQVLENPEEKVSNLRLLLKISDDQTPEIYLTVRKLAIVSLLEVFKDIIPSYKIRNHKDEGVLLKKSTLRLRKFETDLLQYYKKFLQKLEKAAMVLQKKKGNTQLMSKEGKALGELALSSMCDLLVMHPYFNFSENITHVIVPFLNHSNVKVRETVKAAVESIFKEDKKKEVTLKILRVMNHYIKSHSHNVNKEMLQVLLVLRLTDINLDQDKELQLKQKKIMSKKNNVLQLSKKEKKRQKQLKHIERELQETKAQESEQAKQKFSVEITKIVFGIYFRILKNSTNNSIVGVCLEGLAKYAHCINLEYYIEIVNMLDALLKEEWLDFKERLHCIQTIFAILSGQGEVLNVDPTRFYNFLYKSLFGLSTGPKSLEYQQIVLQILNDSLLKRRRKNTNKRMIGFTKRLATVSLQLPLHHGTLGVLGIIRNILQMNKNVDVLLDTDDSVGDGNYMPFLDDPEYSNAASSSLYELVCLSRHYHPIVRKFARNIAHGVPSSGEGNLAPELGKLNSVELFDAYDMTQMAFNPAVQPPSDVKPKKKLKSDYFADSNFEEKCRSKLRTGLRRGLMPL